ncbi:MAG: ABC transporter ATP-binding protein [Sulfuricurvum sp.]|uniref:ABC transporter ATP-binding protein n=2 Tax=Sulfuricurvum sp. TaxID=2025608 RepID=UPI003D14D81D
MEYAITFSNIGYTYNTQRWILRNFNGNIVKGDVFAILGPNGMGKTTFLKILLGLLKPTEGTIQEHGRMAFVPQLFQVSFDYSAFDMVLMGRANKVGIFAQPSRSDEEASMAALERFGLADMAHRPFHEMSGGQRQLVIFARALVAEADIIILDEPTSALDLKNQELILRWIHKLSREEGLTIIFTTHHPHHAHAVAKETLLMFGHDDYICGKVDDVLTETNLKRLYGVNLRQIDIDNQGEILKTIVPVYTGFHR